MNFKLLLRGLFSLDYWGSDNKVSLKIYIKEGCKKRKTGIVLPGYVDVTANYDYFPLKYIIPTIKKNFTSL